MPSRAAGQAAGSRRLLTLAEVTSRSGMAASAIDSYHRHGLLPAPRLIGGQVCYGVRVLRQLALLALAEGAGIQPADMAGLVPADEPSARVARQRWELLAQRRLADLHGTPAAQAVQGCLECRCMNLSRCPLIAAGRERRLPQAADGG
jgi:MerR family transcriptional regulator, redox-sensitive transcriptional activator SoxR